MAGKTRPEASGDGRPFLLEAHYYSGGLRIRALGTRAERPGWVPDEPGNYVGFRDEFAFERDDIVLEFARFAIGGERLTWIGIFHRSVDTSFGDRKNHAGAGIWLRGQRIVKLHALLHGLRQIAAGVAKENVESVNNDVDVFLGSYLPQYVATDTPLPAQLDGWRHSPTRLAETALFVAAEATEREAWMLAAEQVARMSILPGAPSALSRALILVRVGTAAKGFEPVKTGLTSELIGALPEAIADIAVENRTVGEELRMARAQSAKAEAELRDLRAAGTASKARIAELEKQISESDLLRRLAAIDTRLQAIDEGYREERTHLANLNREMQRLKAGTPQQFALAATPEQREVPLELQPVIGERGWRHWWRVAKSYAFAVVLVILICGAMLLLLVDPFGWFGMSLPPLEKTDRGDFSPRSTP